jgi:hypothetical protein
MASVRLIKQAVLSCGVSKSGSMTWREGVYFYSDALPACRGRVTLTIAFNCR